MQLVYDDLFLEHTQGIGHPECPERLLAIKHAMESQGSWKDPVAFRKFPMDVLERIHTKPYIQRLADEPPGPLDPDTVWHSDTYKIAMQALSGAYTGAMETLETKKPSLCLLRPPGHHAGKDYFGGFCYFNNAALVAETARKEGIDRVAIIDIDVHHGNGTRDILADRKDILYASTHQWGIYPGTGPLTDVGEEGAEGYTVNLALPSGSGDSTFEHGFDELLIPILEEYDPGFVVVSIGMDAHYMDPLATLSLSTPGYLSVCERLNELARKKADGRIVYVLEGGYDMEALGDVGSGLAALLDDGNKIDAKLDMIRDTNITGEASIREAIEQHSQYWGL